jgi:SH3-like domain-containing protein
MRRAAGGMIWAAAMALITFSVGAQTPAPVRAATEFRAVSEATVLYDAPAVRGKKLYVAPKGMPFEVVISIEGWYKIRDRSGEMTWVEKKFTTDKRTVLARDRLAVREAADDSARVLIEVAPEVWLDLIDTPQSGWARVRHRDGATGFVRASQVFGL